MKKHNLIRVMRQALPYWPLLLLCFLFVLLANASRIAQPYLLGEIITRFMENKQPDEGISTLTNWGILLFAVMICGSIFAALQSVIVNNVGQKLLKSMRKDVFSHIQRMPMWLLDKYSTGRLIVRGTSDVEAINTLFTDVMVNLFSDIVMLVGIVWVMLQLNVELALVSFAVVPIIVIVVKIVRGKLRKSFAKGKSIIGHINGFFSENIQGMRLVQTFGREKEKMDEFQQLNMAYLKNARYQINLHMAMRPMMQMLYTLAISLLVWVGMGKVAGGFVELGTLFALTNYVKQFFDPIDDMADKYNTVQSAAVSADRIYELLDQANELEDLNCGTQVDAFLGHIEFRNVWFAYQEENWVLRDVSFIVEKGQKIAFVGATGSGKTTIISLLMRFYDIQKGQILIDGMDVRDIRLCDLRRNIAVVLQEVFLFSGTVAENVRLNADLMDEEVYAALKLACADTFVGGLAQGVLSPVAERGSTFSAGQKQLLSFARAVARDPGIFVLDEATANIDTETEQLIQQSIGNTAKGRTTIIIAHRLSTIQTCDVIIALQHGKIVEQGNHETLIQKQGYYARLYEVQFKELPIAKETVVDDYRLQQTIEKIEETIQSEEAFDGGKA